MLSKIIASFLITFSVIWSTNFIKVKTIDDAFYYFNPSYQKLQKNLRADILQLTGLTSEQIPAPPEIPPQKLPVAENVPLPELKIKAGISAAADGRIFYQKNLDQKMPVASLTKLLTALVVLDQFRPEEIIAVSKNAVDTYGEMGNLIVGEKLTIANLLYIMLVDSSNDAAIALAEAVEENGRDPSLRSGQSFVDLMNQKAKSLEMNNSQFTDPAGLNETNISTAADLLKLTNASLANELIKQIINTQEIDVFDIDNKNIHHLKSTNKLFGKINGVAGGKTGYTEEAGECMILVVDSPQNNSYFIAIVLGADIGMRFLETEKLVKWARYTYGW